METSANTMNVERYRDFLRGKYEENKCQKSSSVVTTWDFASNRDEEEHYKLYTCVGDAIEEATFSAERILVTASSDTVIIQRIRPESYED